MPAGAAAPWPDLALVTECPDEISASRVHRVRVVRVHRGFRRVRVVRVALRV